MFKLISMKKLIIILSLFSGSLFAQYTITPEQMRNIILMQENYTYYLHTDSLNNLNIIKYKSIIANQNKIIANKSKINQTLDFQIKDLKRKNTIYKIALIGSGILVGALVIKNY